MSLIKSIQHIADHGAIFTPAWMVEAMLDLVKKTSRNASTPSTCILRRQRQLHHGVKANKYDNDMLPGFLSIDPLEARRVFNVSTAYKTPEDGVAHDFSIVLEDGTNGLVTYYEWDSGRREVRSETIMDLTLKWPRPWEPLCMLVDKVRYKDAFYHRAPVELLVHPTEGNFWAHLRHEPMRTGGVPTGPDVFGMLGVFGVQHWVKEHQLPEHSGKLRSDRLFALFALNDKQGPAILYALTRYNPAALDACPWPYEQFDLFG